MAGKKKLLIIVPTLRLGGQERVATITAHILKDTYDVLMVVFDYRNSVFTPECEVINLNIPATSGTVGKIFHVFQRVLALKRLKRKRHIDISFSVGATACLSNLLSKSKEKTVIRLSSYDEITGGRLNSIIYRISDRIVCCANVTKGGLVKKFPWCIEKAYYVPNPFNVQELLKKGAEPVPNGICSSHTIISCGRLHYDKNFPRVIRALSVVKEKIPDARLIIIGDGAERKRLEELVALYSLEDCVEFLGLSKNPFSYLSRAAVYVQATYYDGFPNALVEAMCFLPVVAADCKSGPREILSDGPLDIVCSGVEIADYGILVKPAADREWHDEITEDDRLLAEGILTLFNSEALYSSMKKRARKRVESFSYDAYRERLLQIFEK